MKKFFALAAIFAATMISFTACEEDKPVGPGPDETPADVCEECGKNPCECEEEFVCKITCDGDFADWAAVTPVSATCNADAKYTALSALKVYTDEMYIHVYFEFSDDEIADREWVPFHVYINQDNNTEGCGDDQWLGQGGQDWLMEGAVIANEFCPYDPGLFKYIGADLATVEWAWEGLLPEGSGIATGAGSGNKYELSIMKEMIPGLELAETFGLGVDIQQSWNSVGVLPNTAITDTNASGAAPMLQVPAVM